MGRRLGHDLKYKYGITWEDYEEWLESQDFSCAICCRHIDDLDGERRLSVDHDHRTGDVRGFLCKGCNLGLGHFGESPERLRDAATYLESRRAIGPI